MSFDFHDTLSINESGMVRAVAFCEVIPGLFQLNLLAGGPDAAVIQLSPGPLNGRMIRVQIGDFLVVHEFCDTDVIYTRWYFPKDDIGAYYTRNESRYSGPLRATKVSPLQPANTEGLCLVGGSSLQAVVGSLPDVAPGRSPWEGVDEIVAVASTPGETTELLLKPEVVANWISFYKRDRALTSEMPDGGIVERLLNAANQSGSRRISDLADQLGVSRRSLQMKTVNAFGIAPKHLLRSQALSLFVSQMATLVHGRKNIGELAFECGFENFAQFSADYRRHFGERPSDTLRRLDRAFRKSQPLEPLTLES